MDSTSNQATSMSAFRSNRKCFPEHLRQLASTLSAPTDIQTTASESVVWNLSTKHFPCLLFSDNCKVLPTMHELHPGQGTCLSWTFIIRRCMLQSSFVVVTTFACLNACLPASMSVRLSVCPSPRLFLPLFLLMQSSLDRWS